MRIEGRRPRTPGRHPRKPGAEARTHAGWLSVGRHGVHVHIDDWRRGLRVDREGEGNRENREVKCALLDWTHGCRCRV